MYTTVLRSGESAVLTQYGSYVNINIMNGVRVSAVEETRFWGGENLPAPRYRLKPTNKKDEI
jgi:hypothetical protein